MAERDYAGVLPTTPPEGLIPWLHDQGYLMENLLIYKMGWVYDPYLEHKVQAVQLTCTDCGETVYTDKIEASDGCHAAYRRSTFGFIHPETKEHLNSGQCCLCPVCGTEVKAEHVSHVTENLSCIECYPLTVTRFEDKLVLIGWCIRKWFTKDAESGITSWPYEAYVVERKGIIRLNAYQKFMSRVDLTDKWAQRKRYHDIWGKSELIYPWNSKLLIGSTAENSKLDRLLKIAKKDGTYPVTYLRLWQKHPNIENLVMQGASRLIIEALDTERKKHSYYTSSRPNMPVLTWVNWKQSSPSKMLGMTKDEYKICLKGKWDVFTLKFWQEEKAARRTLSAGDMESVQSLGALRCVEIRNTTKHDYLKVARYLQKQQKRDRRCDFRILQDYWRIAKDVGSNMSLPDVQFPPRLMAAHDRVEQMRQWREEAKKAAERAARKDLFDQRYDQLKVWAWELDGILIRPARDETELIREGDKLHHCIGSYAGRHAKGETAIFFIRRANAPDKPWFTLEFDEKKLEVRQNRGLRNCDRTKEVTAFELRWIAWCREQAAPKKKRRARQRVQAAAV